MPQLSHQKALTTNLIIGVQVGKNVPNENGDRGVWTARFKFPSQRPKYKSTGVQYEGGSQVAEDLATQRAFELLTREAETYAAGLDINDVQYIVKVADDYLDEIDKRTKENEKLISQDREPIWDVEDGRGYWTNKRFKPTEQIHRLYLVPFFKQLAGHKKQPIIQNIKERELDTFNSWMIENHPHCSPEYRLKMITAMRHIFRYAKRKGYVDSVPSVKRPQRTKLGRKRRELTPDEYSAMIAYTRDRYQDDTTNKTYKDYGYLFHLWILILANTGIRPPTSGEARTLIKWEDCDFHIDKTKPTLKRPDEKGHNYEAIVMPQSVVYWEELKDFYDQRKIDTTEGPIFKHPEDMVNRDGTYKWRKSDPIWSFKSQWDKMTTTLGLRERGRPQSENIVPSALRSWFITQRLYSDDNIRVEELSRATGTSVDVIMSHYYAMDTKKRYEALTAGGIDNQGLKRLYDKNGYYIGHATEPSRE